MHARGFRRLLLIVLASFALVLGLSGQATAVSPDIVISQVYGGGGNSQAPLRNDFIELFNRGTSSVNVSGWSVQYAATTGVNWQVTNLSGSIPAGGYYLVQEAAGTTTPAAPALPTPDATGSINMAAGAGKVVVVSNQTLIPSGTSCPTTGVVDLVGYGTGTNCFEGTGPTANTSNTTAALRAANGCTDTDQNSADFATGAPNPRNSASTANACVAADTAPTVSSTTPANGAVDVSGATNITVAFSEPVNATGTWFTISCTTSGAHSATVTGGPTTFTLDPDVSFTAGDQCTVTVVAAQVADQDTVDPPDQMTADHVFGFGVGNPCENDFTPIHDIQGSGSSAAITGDLTTEGVVVGDFETNAGLQGFYLQDVDGDSNAETSDGIFVFTGPVNTVSAGQLVRVTGFARELFFQTALNGSDNNAAAVPPANIVNCGTGPSLIPTDVNVPFETTTFPERFEGMLVRLPQPLVISEYFNYDRFGEIVLAQPLSGETRHFTPTLIEEPGAAANARTAAYLRSRITLDDAANLENPSFTRHPNGDAFTLANRFRGGDTVRNTIGVLGFGFNLYRIQPTAPAQHTAANPRPGASESVGGVRVATMNTLNFFLTLDFPTGNALDNKCGPGQNVECRGADSNQPTEFTRQRDKLLRALAGLDADVIGLNELENTTGVDPLGNATGGIVPGLNAMLGAGTYDYIDTEVIGTDAIRVGLIYRPGVVTSVGGFETLTTADDPRFRDNLNRPVLAQTFEVNATGARFTVAVNHLKSKGSDCDAVGDPDARDGQGNCNGTRTLAAQALVDWLATDPTGSGDPDFLIMGDLNAYAKEDPIDAVRAGADDTTGTGDDYTNLVERFEGPFAYSFVFNGQAGYLDHGLASSTVADQVIGATEWHINADEPDLIDYDTSFKSAAQDAIYAPDQFRSADHDPLVVSLCEDVVSCPATKLGVAADELEETILLASPRARDKLEDVLEKVEKALQKLGQSNSDPQGAAGEIEGAVGDLEAALTSRLLGSTQANALLQQLTGAARLLAVVAIAEAKTTGGNPGKISEAEAELARGDARRGQSRFTDAVAKYKDALSKAEGA